MSHRSNHTPNPFKKLYRLLGNPVNSITMNCKAIAPNLDIHHKYFFMLITDPEPASQELTKRAWKLYKKLIHKKPKPAITVRYDDEEQKERHLQLTNQQRIEAFEDYLEKIKRNKRIWNLISQTLETDI